MAVCVCCVEEEEEEGGEGVCRSQGEGPPGGAPLM